MICQSASWWLGSTAHHQSCSAAAEKVGAFGTSGTWVERKAPSGPMAASRGSGRCCRNRQYRRHSAAKSEYCRNSGNPPRKRPSRAAYHESVHSANCAAPVSWCGFGAPLGPVLSWPDATQR